MPLLKFRNYLSASRKRNMIGFGMYRNEANADMSVIDDVASGSVVITGTQDGSNAAFTLSTVPTTTDDLIIARNGLIQRPGVGNDFTISGSTLTFSIPPAADDILMGFVTGGE